MRPETAAASIKASSPGNVKRVSSLQLSSYIVMRLVWKTEPIASPRTTAHTECQQYFQMFQKLEMFLSLSARWLERGQRSKAYLVTGRISICLEDGLSDRCSVGEQEMLRSDLLQVNSHVIYGYGCSERSPADWEHSAKANLGNVYKYNTCTKMSYCVLQNIHSLYDA